jgi:hypothetical protein
MISDSWSLIGRSADTDRPTEDRATAYIAADRDSIWDMVSDIKRMGQWSSRKLRQKFGVARVSLAEV